MLDNVLDVTKLICTPTSDASFYNIKRKAVIICLEREIDVEFLYQGGTFYYNVKDILGSVEKSYAT